MNDGRSGSSSIFLSKLFVKGSTKAKVKKQRNSPIRNYLTQLLLTFVSAAFDDISIGFLLSYSYIKGAECLQWLFKKVLVCKEKNRKQFKDTVQKH